MSAKAGKEMYLCTSVHSQMLGKMVVLDGEHPSPSTSVESILAFDAADYFTDDETIDIEPEDQGKDFLPILASNQNSRQCSICFKIKKFITKIKDKANANVLQSSGRIFCGVILAFLSGCIFAGNSTIVQYFKLDYTDAMLVRSLSQLVFFGSMCGYKRLSLWPCIGERPKLVRAMIILQGLLSGFMLIAVLYSVIYMPLGDAMALHFMAPLFTMILAAIFLKHSIRLYKISCGILLLVGGALVIQPPFIFNAMLEPDSMQETIVNSTSLMDFQALLTFNTYNLQAFNNHSKMYYIGAIIAIVAALMDGIISVSISWCAEVKTYVLLWWGGLGGFLAVLISFTTDENTMVLSPKIVEIPLSHWLAFGLISIGGIIGFFCMTKSLQLIDPTLVTFLRALEIILGYGLQIVIMGQVPSIISISGGLIVVFSVIAMGLYAKIHSKIPEYIQFLF